MKHTNALLVNGVNVVSFKTPFLVGAVSNCFPKYLESFKMASLSLI